MTKTRLGRNALATKDEHGDLKRPKPKQEEKLTSQKRVSFTVQVDPEVLEKARDAVYHTPGLTLADLVESSLADALKKLESKNGEFPKRPGALQTGRPVR